ncbi:hypothetical protein [Myxococcus sp. RHSTA-1-4]|uniref:hypothetical protein n=1 Tax=Myxococcus sp. RHSTA-1-4 TaxID=2874601 RepID=UPI001CBCCE7B|nr:hypothetical protein [Myxococcus sp. RHSTA-1-4]MBZ4422182.1 hypothetical protein [Myxococcus sp. RHSTA-1-4]
MHDLDMPQAESFEFEFNSEGEWNEVFQESELNELASELLGVQSDQELEQFLGKLIETVASTAGKVVKSPVGKQLGGMLKGVAKQALPVVGGALGSMVAPGLGTAVGSKLGSLAGKALGLELEGLSQEDREFEAAKQVVRLAGDASRTALAAPPGANPARVAGAAVGKAVQKFAPGLAGVVGAMAGTGAQSGRWVRKGNRIVLFGV